MREVRRFLKVKMQTIVAPALTALLYLAVFRYAMGDRHVPGLSVPYFTFLVPGLAMMSMLQNAFANTSSSIVTSKVMNVHIYLLMAPLSAGEVVAAFLAAAVVRALVVAFHPLMMLYYGVCSSIIMGSMGLIGGIWSRKFDDIALISNFVILPLTFLSGVFYTAGQLPPLWRHLNEANPFFYLIDGFRFGFLGVGDTDPARTVWIAGLVSLGCIALCWQVWRSGWRLKE
jgi:ABC-2 type transport system permease protein